MILLNLLAATPFLWVYDKKVTLSGKVAHATFRAAALNEERLRNVIHDCVSCPNL